MGFFRLYHEIFHRFIFLLQVKNSYGKNIQPGSMSRSGPAKPGYLASGPARLFFLKVFSGRPKILVIMLI